MCWIAPRHWRNSVLAKTKPIVQSLDKVVDKLSTIKQIRVDQPETLYDEYTKLKNNNLRGSLSVFTIMSITENSLRPGIEPGSHH